MILRIQIDDERPSQDYTDPTLNAMTLPEEWDWLRPESWRHAVRGIGKETLAPLREKIIEIRDRFIELWDELEPIRDYHLQEVRKAERPWIESHSTWQRRAARGAIKGTPARRSVPAYAWRPGRRG